jgi:hypothetical protein
MSKCKNPECAAMLVALESAMTDPPKAQVALTVLEAKAAEELLAQFAILRAQLSRVEAERDAAVQRAKRLREALEKHHDSLEMIRPPRCWKCRLPFDLDQPDEEEAPRVGHVNLNCRDEARCEPHGEVGPVHYIPADETVLDRAREAVQKYGQVVRREMMGQPADPAFLVNNIVLGRLWAVVEPFVVTIARVFGGEGLTKEVFMGWAYCGQDDFGREIGYGIVATCDKKGCDRVIDRGLGYVCGPMHGASEGGCGRYFCGEHSGSVGPRGGCPHRFEGAHGATMCQPMRRDDGEVYCACHFNHYVEWPETEEVA